MLKILKKEGFASLVEVIVTAVIFSLAAFGVFTTISMLRPHGADSLRKLEAAYVAKGVIDELRAYVDARMWDNEDSLLSTNGYHNTTIGNYMVNWWLNDVPGLNVRELQMEVYYLN